MDKTLRATCTLSQREIRSNDNKGTVHIPKGSGVSP